MKDKDVRDIVSRLDILIRLHLSGRNEKKSKETTRKNVAFLNEYGLDYKEIARLLDMGPGTVANELTAIKRGKK